MSAALAPDVVEKLVLNAKRRVQGHPILSTIQELRSVQRTRAVSGKSDAQRFGHIVQESLAILLTENAILLPYYTVVVVPGGRKDRIGRTVSFSLPSRASSLHELRAFALQSVQQSLVQQAPYFDDLVAGWRGYFLHHHVAVDKGCAVSLAVGVCVSAPGWLFAVSDIISPCHFFPPLLTHACRSAGVQWNSAWWKAQWRDAETEFFPELYDPVWGNCSATQDSARRERPSLSMKILTDASLPVDLPFGNFVANGAGRSGHVSHALAYCNSAEVYRRQMTPAGLLGGMAPRKPRAVQSFPVVAPVFQSILETGLVPACPPPQKRQPHSLYSKIQAACKISPAHYSAVISSARDGGTPAGARFELVLNYDVYQQQHRHAEVICEQLSIDSRALTARLSVCTIESLAPRVEANDADGADGPALEARAASRALLGVSSALVADLKVAIMNAMFKIVELTIFQRQMQWSYSNPGISSSASQLSLADREMVAWMLISANSLLTNKMPKTSFALQHYNLVCLSLDLRCQFLCQIMFSAG